MKLKPYVCLLVLLGIWVTVANAGDQPHFMGLGGDPDPTGFRCQAVDVSGNGRVVVGALPLSGGGEEAFRWTQEGGFIRLGDLPGGNFESRAYGTSFDGSVVVGDSHVGFGDYNGFAWTLDQGGTMTDLGGYYARKVSDDGSVIVGYWNGGAARLEGGTLTQLGDLPGGLSDSHVSGLSGDGSVVVGRGVTDTGFEAFRWTEGKMIGIGHLVEGAAFSEALSVSPDGQVVVGISDGTEGRQAFRWTAADGMVGLGDLPGGNFYSIAEDASWDGSVIVGSSTANSQYFGDAFIWNAGHGMRNLQEVLVTEYGLTLDGWHLDVAKGVSYDGKTIVGNGRNPAGDYEAWIAHIPEPATAGLFGYGLTLMMAFRRRVLRH